MAINIIEGNGIIPGAEYIKISKSGISDKKSNSPIRFPGNAVNQPSTMITITKNNIETNEAISSSTNSAMSSLQSSIDSQTNSTVKTGLETIKNVLEGGGEVFSTLNQALNPNIKSKDIYTISLPMPVDLNVSYNAEWSGQSLGPIAHALREMIQGNFTSDAVAQATGTLTKRGITEGIKGLLGGHRLTSGALSGAGKSAGIAFNPYKELVYDSPSFRTFEFDWVLSPRNQQESDSLRKIIYILKKHMHPSVFGEGSDSLLFLYPETCNIAFLTGTGGGNPYLFQLDDCAITNVSVFYDNKFHQGTNAPAAVSIKLSLLETKILTQSDFGDNLDALTY